MKQDGKQSEKKRENADKYKDLTKDEKIKKEIRRLTLLLKNIDNNTKKTISNLINNAAFMAITLDDLQIEINKNGIVSEYKNGENQWGTKKSPEIEIYNTMVKNYSSIIKQLTDLLPKKSNQESDGFEEFVNKRC